MNHDKIERRIGWMALFTVLVISIGGLAEIVPLFFQKQTTEPVEGLKPLTALELEGRDIYIREGCSVCHTQMIRTLPGDVARYGHHSLAGEAVYNHPFLWGSKRTGPDLARVGGRYSDDWHRVHLIKPQDLVPESNMPAFPWLFENKINHHKTGRKMQALAKVGVPYTQEDIAGAGEAVKNKTEGEAVIAYLQQLGLVLSKGHTP